MNAPGTGDALIEALRRPDAYPHAVSVPIRVVETHVSWVFLTGPYAYKIKKPLRLSFLDYSSPERRARLCAEEVRLNRRFAPDLYLDVAPVLRSGTHIHFGGDCGEPIEHAVRMVQFDTREELDALVARDAVTIDELTAFGRRLAQFHASAAPADAATGFGSAARVRRVMLDNFTELEGLGVPPAMAGAAARLRDWSEREFVAHESLFEARRSGGHVRECHGDLHCANVIRWRGELTPFDGIEFDPALRYVDVLNDLAFLTMDLAVRGRRDLRHALLNAWLESLGDYPGLPLLPGFEAYRALVRAKVAAIGAKQHARDERAHHAGMTAAERYLDWAVQRTARPAPSLFLTCGLSGSGKTWLARRFASTWPALLVRSDIERKRLGGLAPLADSRSPPDAGLYTREFNALTYERLERCAEAGLHAGESVIVDAAFLRHDERERFVAMAGRAGAPALILHCTAPLDTLRERISARRQSGADASEADVALLDRQPSYWEPLDERQSVITIHVDTTQPDADARAAQVARERFSSPP